MELLRRNPSPVFHRGAVDGPNSSTATHTVRDRLKGLAIPVVPALNLALSLVLSLAQTLTLPLALTLALSLALTAVISPAWANPPEMSVPALVPGDAVPALAADDQAQPAIARGGDYQLAVWADQRSNRGGYDIYGARLDAQGDLIDLFPIPILLDGAAQTVPQVAWNGTHWLVACADSEDPVGTGRRLRAVRVSDQGQVLDPTPIVIAQQASDILALTSDGSNWALFWSGIIVGNGAIRGARISPDGTVLDPGGMEIVPETYYIRFNLSAASTGGQYLLTWSAVGSVQGVRLTAALDPIGPVGFTVFSAEAVARLASSEQGYLAVASTPGWHIYERVIATRIDLAGQVLDNPPLEVTPTAYFGARPDAAFDGANWIVAWRHPGLRVARITPGGQVLDPDGVAIDVAHAASHEAPAIGPVAGGGAQIVWAGWQTQFLDIFTVRVDGQLAEDPAFGIALGAPSQTTPRMATDGATTMIVYKSTIAGAARIMAMPIDETGGFTLTEPVEVAAGTDLDLGTPSVACDGDYFLVVWPKLYEGVYGRRYLADGTAVDPQPFFIVSGMQPDVGALPGTFLVAVSRYVQYPENTLIYAVRVRASDGQILGSPTALGTIYSVRPRVTAVAGRWLVVWERHPSHNNPWANIAGNFVEAGGAPGSEFFLTAGEGGRVYNYEPAVAANDTVVLVTWESRLSSTDWDLYAVRVNSAGGLLGPSGGSVLAAAAHDQTASAIAWDGTRFLVLFEDERNAVSNADQRPDIFAARVLPDGTIEDPSGFAVADARVSETWPAVIAQPGQPSGLTTLAYASLVPDAPYAAERVMVRFIGLSSAGVAGGEDRLPIRLPRAFPNPSHGRVQFALPEGGVTGGGWGVFDVSGRLRARIDGDMWDGADLTGRPVGAGVYFVRPIGAKGEGPRITLVRR